MALNIVLGASIAPSFKSSFRNANLSVKGISKNINKLSDTKLKIKSFQNLSRDTFRNRAELRNLRKELRRAEIDTNNLEEDSKKLRKSLVKLNIASKINFKISNAKEVFLKQKDSIENIKSSVYGLSKVFSNTFDVLKSQGEIKSLGMSKKGIKSITKAGHELSLQFGKVSAPTFIKASSDIKSGISSLSDESVKSMTKMATITAIATSSSISEMTKLYTLGYKIFREDFSSDIDFGKQFSGAITSTKKVFGISASSLAKSISNIGVSARAMGISLEEQLAIIGMSKATFNSAFEAGASYSAFLSGIGNAQKELGLQFTDSNGKMLPMVEILEKIKEKYGDLELAEKDELETAFGSDVAIKTITALLPKIKELQKAQEDLKKAMDSNVAEEMAKAMDSGYGFEKMANASKYLAYTFGKSVEPAINLVAKGMGKLARTIAYLDEKVPFLIPTFAGITAGITGLITVLKIGTLAKLGLSFATNTLKKSVLLSSAANLMEALSLKKVAKTSALATLKTKMHSFAKAMVVAKTKALTIANNLYKASLKGTGTALGSVSAKLKAFSFTSIASSVKVKALTFATKAFNWVLRANPIGLVISGLFALGAGVVWAYNKFDWFRTGVDNTWSFIKKMFSFSPLGLIVGAWGKGFDYFKVKFEWLSKKIAWFKSITSMKLKSFFGFGSSKEDESKQDKKQENTEEKNAKLNTVQKHLSEEKQIISAKDSKEIVEKRSFDLKRVAVPVVMSTTLAANSLDLPKQSLYIPSDKQIEKTRQENIKNNINSSSAKSQINKNYNITISVANASSNIDIKQAVKQAIKEANEENFEEKIEDVY